MFRKLYIAFVLLVLTAPSMAVTIDIDDTFVDVARTAALNGSFTTNFATPGSSITDINTTTYIFSSDSGAYIDLSFTQAVYDGNGFDISIYLVGGGEQGHSLDISLINGATSSVVRNYNSLTYSNYGFTGWSFPEAGKTFSIFRMDIDLADFGFLGTSPIDKIRLGVGGNSAVPSLVGALNNTPTVIPLPLPVVLFGSGLAMLGFVARKKR